MGVIALSHDQIWKIARHEYYRLLDAAGPFLKEQEDLRAVVEAKALDGLHLDKTANDQAERLRAALVAAARRVSVEIQNAPEADARDTQFAQRLDELCRLLQPEQSSGGRA